MSIIVPMGRPERAGTTLRSIAAQLWKPKQWELIIVGRRAEAVARNHPDLPVKSISLDSRETPAMTRSLGIEVARGDWLALVDDDICLANDYLLKAWKYLQDAASGENIGALAGRLPGGVGNFADNWVNIANFWYQQGRDKKPRYWFYTAAIVVSREAYDSIGGFNTSIPSGEDVDLTGRLLASGYGLRYEPDLVAYHHHGRTTMSRVLKYFFDNGITARFLNQGNPAMRCFSFKTASWHAWNDYKSNRLLNQKQLADFDLYAPFIILAYYIFQLSLEWNYQKIVWAERSWRSLPRQCPSDELAAKAFECFASKKRIQGAWHYVRAIFRDRAQPLRR